MAYVKRQNGNIVAYSKRPNPGFVAVADTDADLQAFLAPPDADKRAEADIENSSLARLLFKLNFDQENRIRALENRPSVTRKQYKTALIERWKAP